MRLEHAARRLEHGAHTLSIEKWLCTPAMRLSMLGAYQICFFHFFDQKLVGNLSINTNRSLIIYHLEQSGSRGRQPL